MTLYNRLIKKTLRENVIPFNGDRSKLSWRKEILREFGEWAPIEGSGPTNSTSQTFGYYVDGDLQTNFETGEPITSTVSGLGGIESVPTTTTIDYGFGDVSTVDAPTYNQLAMQGYAKPLGFNVNRRTDFQDVNPYLDASQEFAQRVGADYMMNARVQQTIRQEVETDLTKIAAKFDSSLIENMGQNIKLAVEAIMNGQQPPLVAPPDPPFTGMSYEQMVDEQNKVNDKYNDLLAPLYKELNSYAGQLAPAGLVAKINALVEKQGQETNALYEKYSKYNQEYGDLLAKRADEWSKFVNAIEDYRKGFNSKSSSQEIAQVMDGENLLPPDLQDILRRARNEPANSGSTAGERDKRKILDFLETPEGQNITPQMFDSLMNIYMRSQTNPFGVDYGNIASTSLKGLVSNPPSQEVAQVDVLKSFTDIVTLPQKTLDKAVDTLIGGIEKTLGKKAESAINVLNYHKEWQKNPTPEPQDLTSSLSKGDYNYLVKMVKDVVSSQPSTATDETLTQMITNALVTHQLKDAEADRPGLRNIFGNLDSARKESGPDGDGAYVVTDKKGNSYVEFRKAYDFDNAFDFAGVGNPLMTFGAIPYGIKKLGPYASFFGTDTMNIVVRVPIRKKKQNESTVWDRTKKRLNECK